MQVGRTLARVKRRAIGVVHLGAQVGLDEEVGQAGGHVVDAIAMGVLGER